MCSRSSSRSCRCLQKEKRTQITRVPCVRNVRSVKVFKVSGEKKTTFRFPEKEKGRLFLVLRVDAPHTQQPSTYPTPCNLAVTLSQLTFLAPVWRPGTDAYVDYPYAPAERHALLVLLTVLKVRVMGRRFREDNSSVRSSPAAAPPWPSPRHTHVTNVVPIQRLLT